MKPLTHPYHDGCEYWTHLATPHRTVTVNPPTRTFTWPLVQKPSLWRRVLRFLHAW